MSLGEHGRTGRPGGKRPARSKKDRVVFLCSDCGDTSMQWYGQCPSCGQWNTLKEYRPPTDPSGRAADGSMLGRPAAGTGWAARVPGGILGRGLGSGSAPGAAPAPRTEAGTGTGDASGRGTAAGGSGSAHVRGTPRSYETEETNRTGLGPGGFSIESGGVIRLDDVPRASVPRTPTGIGELDRILGGGLVPGSVVLLGGDPGIGKSTLLLQAAGSLVIRGLNVLYVSGEESATQIRLRADRLDGVPPELMIQTETNLEIVADSIDRVNPGVVIVDSIQTAYLPAAQAAPGSITQVRESALALIQIAKARGMAIILVGHVTKEGTLAGPRTLEHMVDTVLYMEGERYQHYRILRSVKNRFGSVNELGVFEMLDRGLREVPNPSQIFLSEHTAGAVGSVVSASIEGTRALLMEIQALVHQARYGTPQRLSTGYEPRRLAIVLAVLAKRAGIDCSEHDVFVNIAGGLRAVEPGVDLCVLLAVASSRTDRPPHPDLVVLGEVGLGGEVRRIAHPDRRIAEAARLGYKRMLLPEANTRDLGKEKDGIRLIGVRTVVEALHEGLGDSREATPRPRGRGEKER